MYSNISLSSPKINNGPFSFDYEERKKKPSLKPPQTKPKLNKRQKLVYEKKGNIYKIDR